jgi:zinc protease
MTQHLTSALNADYEAYVDEVITEPLIAKLPKAGKVKSVNENSKFGTTEMTLSNGVKVVVKPTDFASDQIILNVYREGGLRSYDQSQADNLKVIDDAYDYSKLGNFDVVKLRKYLAGKHVSLGFSVGNYFDSFNGQTTVKDLPTLMELLYASFTSVNPDQSSYDAFVSQTRPFLANADKDPNKIFQKELKKTRYGDNKLLNEATVETLDNANYTEMVNLIKKATENAADYTFMFTGNVDVETLRPLLEQYVATLPAKKNKRQVKTVSPLTTAKGNVNNTWKQPMQTPSTMIFDVYSDNNIDTNIENSVKLGILGDILGNKYTETLREEEGGTYSPDAYAGMNFNTGEWLIIYAVQTNADQQAKMIERANKELLELLNNGADEVEFAKVKEATLKQYEINSRTNQYWSNYLLYANQGLDLISNHRAAIENLTLADFNAFIKTLYNGKNRVEVIMEGVAEN